MQEEMYYVLLNSLLFMPFRKYYFVLEYAILVNDCDAFDYLTSDKYLPSYTMEDGEWSLSQVSRHIVNKLYSESYCQKWAIPVPLLIVCIVVFYFAIWESDLWEWPYSINFIFNTCIGHDAVFCFLGI